MRKNKKVLMSKSQLMEVLDRNFAEAKIEITIRRYNKILTDLGFDLETRKQPLESAVADDTIPPQVEG